MLKEARLQILPQILHLPKRLFNPYFNFSLEPTLVCGRAS